MPKAARNHKSKAKDGLVYIGVRVRKATYDEMEEIVAKENQTERLERYLMAHLIRELLVSGVAARKKN